MKEVQNIDLVINLEPWDQNKDYDRLGMEDHYEEILGVGVVCNTLPVRPGRNLAIICETAAVNRRQKKMGYNAAKELYNRVTENMMKSAEQHAMEEKEAALIEERRRIGAEMNAQFQHQFSGHLPTIEPDDIPENYGEMERNSCRVESESADNGLYD